MATFKFPAIVRLARQAERNLWRIGDAINEVAPSDSHGKHSGRLNVLASISQELASIGLTQYTVDHLRDFARTASAFHDGDRSPSVPRTVHLVARSKAGLRRIVAAAKRDGVKLTVAFGTAFTRQARAAVNGEHPSIAGYAFDNPTTVTCEATFIRAFVDLSDRKSAAHVAALIVAHAPPVAALLRALLARPRLRVAA